MGGIGGKHAYVGMAGGQAGGQWAGACGGSRVAPPPLAIPTPCPTHLKVRRAVLRQLEVLLEHCLGMHNLRHAAARPGVSASVHL